MVCVVAPPAYATYDQVREVFALARTKPACILFFDEIDTFGGVRHGGTGEGEGDNEVQRTMLELLNQLDGFDRRGNVKAGIRHVLFTRSFSESTTKQTLPRNKNMHYQVSILVLILCSALL